MTHKQVITPTRTEVLDDDVAEIVTSITATNGSGNNDDAMKEFWSPMDDLVVLFSSSLPFTGLLASFQGNIEHG